MVQGFDRRVHARVDKYLQVQYGADDGSFTEARVINISKGGCFIESDDPRPIGSNFEIILSLPELDEEITVLGKVVRHVGMDPNFPSKDGIKGMGIQFLMVEPKLEEQLNGFIDHLLELQGEGNREHPRVSSQLMVKFSNVDDLTEAFALNISRGGLFIQTDSPFKLRERVEILLVHPETNEELPLSGIVVHRRETLHEVTDVVSRGIGVKFVDLSPDIQTRLSRFIHQIATG